jgi:hypothetical protein
MLERRVQKAREMIEYPKTFEQFEAQCLDKAEENGLLDGESLLSLVNRSREGVEEIRDALLKKKWAATDEIREEAINEFEGGVGSTIETLMLIAHLGGADVLSCLSVKNQEIK